MQVLLLGAVEAIEDGVPLKIGGPKVRALLALLSLNANQVVSRDRLIDGLWGERPPPSAGHTLEDYVSRLRKALGAARIETRPPGYVLRLEPDECDTERFESLVGEGRSLLEQGHMTSAVDRLEAALAVWRGAALGDVLDAPYAASEARRLEEARIEALELCLGAQLETSDPRRVIPALEGLLEQHPFRERLVTLLMTALYRAGRHTEALAVFRALRAQLSDQLGLEPGSELRRLEQRILSHDPSLDAPGVAMPAGHASSRRHPRRLAAVLGVVAIAALGGIAYLTTHPRGARAPVETARADELVSFHVTSRRIATHATLDAASTSNAVGRSSVWVAAPDAEAVLQFDERSGRVVDRVRVIGGIDDLAIGGGSVWGISGQGGVLVRIDPETASITQTLPLGGARAAAIAFDRNSLWVADTVDEALLELDPANGGVRRVIQLGIHPTSLAVGPHAFWVADYNAGAVVAVDRRSAQVVSTTHVGNGPTALAIAEDAVWVTNALDSTVSRIDPLSGDVAATVPVGSSPDAVAVADGYVWTTNRYSDDLSQIDPRTNRAIRAIALGGEPSSLTAHDRTLWIGVQPKTRLPGGTLRLLRSAPLSTDPDIQVNASPLQTGGLTSDGLVTYNHVGGAAGTQLVPDLAVALPQPTDNGTTYTFRLRPGIHYSDGRFVRPSDFRRAFLRLFRFAPLNTNSFRGIVGGEHCIAVPQRCDLRRGIVVDDAAGTVTFHLTSADPSFIDSLTYGSLAAPIPAGIPLRAIGSLSIPGTGPYEVRHAAASELVYVRNPYFHEWSHAAQPDGVPDRIEVRFGLSAAEEASAIVAGKADWTSDPIPQALAQSIRRLHPRLLHSAASAETDWFQFNTAEAPFDDIRVRTALNLAIDRRRVAQMFGGSFFATPTCQLLPSGVPGYRRTCPWRTRDVARARRLVAASRTRGVAVTVWGWTDDPYLRPVLTRYVGKVLAQLGYRVHTHLVPHAALQTAPLSAFAHIQLIPTGWFDPTADNFFSTWFACNGVGNHGWFCSRSIDRWIRLAHRLDATEPQAAGRLWSRVDRALGVQAALVPLVNERATELTSARLGNYQYNPYWGMIADQVTVR